VVAAALAILGLVVNLLGAIAVARSRLELGDAIAQPDASERIYSTPGRPRQVTGSVSVVRSSGWWLGWTAIVVGYGLQIAAVAWPWLAALISSPAKA
jgi:hypothetical protein